MLSRAKNLERSGPRQNCDQFTIMFFAELLIKLCEIRELDVSHAFDAAMHTVPLVSIVSPRDCKFVLLSLNDEARTPCSD